MKDGMLELKDAPMFGRVMRDKEICKETLQRILGIEIEDIEYLNAEQALNPAADAKGVRLDVFAKGSGKVYDIEMQRANKPSLGRRMRYYQASMDVDVLHKGDDYDSLPESFVIFICEEDPFGADKPVYRFERLCTEHERVELGDSSHWLVLNASAWSREDDKKRAVLLRCIYDGEAPDALGDPFVQKLMQAIHGANADRAWRGSAMGFMTLEHSHRVELRAARDEGEALGEAQASTRYDLLIKKLIEDGRIDDLKRASDDSVFRDQLFAELGI